MQKMNCHRNVQNLWDGVLVYTLYGFLRLIQDPFFLRNRFDDLPFDLHKAVKEILDSGKTLFSVEDFDKTLTLIDNFPYEKKSYPPLRNIESSALYGKDMAHLKLGQRETSMT